MGWELEDLHLGIVCGEQHLAAAIAVEVGDERRREAVHVVLDREPVVRQVVPRLLEREVTLVLSVVEGDGSARVPDRIGEGGRRRADLEREEDGEGGEEEDAEVALPHLGSGEEL